MSQVEHYLHLKVALPTGLLLFGRRFHARRPFKTTYLLNFFYNIGAPFRVRRVAPRLSGPRSDLGALSLLEELSADLSLIFVPFVLRVGWLFVDFEALMEASAEVNILEAILFLEGWDGGQISEGFLHV